MTDIEKHTLTQESVLQHNRQAWDINADMGNRWTCPVSDQEIDEARRGHLKIKITPGKPVPKHWYPNTFQGKKVLLLAGGGGQQGPLLAAAGAEVTVADISPKQLERDWEMAKRHQLLITTLETPANDLSSLPDQKFDFLINPCSCCFFPELDPVWLECARVLKPSGELWMGFNNPLAYAFDFELANRGEFRLRYPVPYSDTHSLSPQEKEKFLGSEVPLEYGHSLTDVMGGLCQSGFNIQGLYEDYWDSDEPINQFFPQFIALKAVRLHDH